MKYKSLFKIFIKLTLALVFGAFLLNMSSVPRAYSAGEYYKYNVNNPTSNPTIIYVTNSSQLESGKATFNIKASDKSSLTYISSATALTHLTINQSPIPAPVAPNAPAPTSTADTCYLALEIKLASAGAKTGIINMPSDLNYIDLATAEANRKPNEIPVAQTTTYKNLCSTKLSTNMEGLKSKFPEFNNKSITINYNDVEAADQKEISLQINPDKAIKDIPASIDVTIAKKSAPSSIIQTKTIFKADVNLEDISIYGGFNYTLETVFTDISAGEYQICFSAAKLFIKTQADCTTVTKVFGKRLVVSIDSGVSYDPVTGKAIINPRGKMVQVLVSFAIDIDNETENAVMTFGPISIDIMGSLDNKVVKTGSTNSVRKEDLSDPTKVVISWSADGIEPGKYKACLTSDHTACSDEFTKEINKESIVNIRLDGAKAIALEDKKQLTCAVDGIGWIVCPVLKFLGSITDGAFEFLAGSFLGTNTKLLNADPNINNGNTGTYDAWKIMRNIANVAFVIVFLIIIFSQLTSFGIDNYGIKKMLPKLIIAAILVNISFFICQIAVDISNILGYSLSGFFDSVIASMPMTAPDPNAPSALVSGLTWVGITAAAVGAGAILLLSITFPVILAALLAVLMTILILLVRTALIVILVVVSPLAFVMYLLPNTESWFKKWKDMFTSLLLVFPIIALLFGGGKLAAQILNSAAAGSDIKLQLIAMGVGVVPLFAVPSLLKGSLNAAGSIGKTLSGWSDKANSNIGKQVKETSLAGAYSTAFKRNQQIKRAQITGGVYKGKNPVTRGVSKMNAAINASTITGLMGTRTAQQAAQLANKLDIENVTASKAQIEQAIVTGAELKLIADGETVKGIKGSDPAVKAAAMEGLLERGQFTDFESSWNRMIAEEGSTKGGSETMRMTASTLSRSSSKPTFMGAGDLQAALEGHAVNDSGQSLDLSQIAVRGAESNRYSPLKTVAASNQELEYVFERTLASGSAAGINNLRNSSTTALDNVEVELGIGNNRKWIEFLAGRGPHP